MKKQIENEDYLTSVLIYIHNNAIKHGIVDNSYDCPYNSFLFYASEDLPKSLKLLGRSKKNEVFEWFGGREKFILAHKYYDFPLLDNYYE